VAGPRKRRGAVAGFVLAHLRFIMFPIDSLEARSGGNRWPRLRRGSQGGTVLRLFLNDGDSAADFELLILGEPIDQTMLIGVTDLP
jgi:hypothetical protein